MSTYNTISITLLIQTKTGRLLSVTWKQSSGCVLSKCAYSIDTVIVFI